MAAFLEVEQQSSGDAMNESDSQQAENESSSQRAERDFARRQRLAFGLLAIFFLVLVFFSVKMVDLFRVISSFEMRLPLLALSGLMVFLNLLLIVVLLHRKWTTGRFILTRAEAMADQEAVWNKLGAGKPFRPQAKYYAVLVILLLIFPVLAILPISILKIYGGRPPLSLLILILLLFATILALPAWYVFKTIRRKLKTGSVLPSQEEIAKARARSRKPQPLALRILIANVMALNAGMLTSFAISEHIRHLVPDFPWSGLAAFMWFMSVFFAWQVFRPIQPLFGLQDAPDESQRNPLKSLKLIALAIVLPLALASIFPISTLCNVHPIHVIYPPPAQAKADLAAALQSAAQNHKRILLDFGASWCPDCQALDRYYHDANNQPLLASNYILVLVNTANGYSNLDLAKTYEVPLDKGIPALAVLNDKGELLYSQKNGEFEDMRHLKSSDLTDFLLRWKP
jgi:thiol-disulfide isomerase/thioredoxin